MLSGEHAVAEAALAEMRATAEAEEARRRRVTARLECEMADRRIRHLDRRFVTDRMLYGFGRNGRRGWKLATERVLHEERRSDLRSFLADEITWDDAQQRLLERLGLAKRWGA